MPATSEEQYHLELLNDARLNPMGDAARYITGYSPLTSQFANVQQAFNFFNVNGSALLQQYQTLTPVQPLAWNEQLATAARGHNTAMIAADQQTHQAPGEADIAGRANNAGYTNWSRLAENVYAFSDDPLYAHAAFMVDWGQGPNGIQDPPGHRNSIMNGALREVGIAQVAESNPSTQVGPQLVTQDFGARFGTGSFIVGVAYNDANANRFYTPGEGLGGLSVSLGGGSTSSAASGGYALESFANGAQTISFSGAGLSGPVSVSVSLAGAANIKIDVINGAWLKTSTSMVVSGPITTIEGLGVFGLNLVATGSNAHNLIGTASNDSLDGGSGADCISGSWGADFIRGLDGNDDIYAGGENDDANGNMGADTVRGEDGADTVRGGQGNDQVFGGNGDDGHVNGNIGEDLVYGGEGNDTVFGGQGADSLYGENGNDWLSGDLGDDVLNGGSGADRFLMRAGGGIDWVADFNSASGDRIQLSPGQGYTIVSESGQAVIDLGGGSRIGLVGVSVSQMGDWLIVV